MLFLPVNGCISIKFPIPLLLLFLNPCQSKPLTSGAQALPARKNPSGPSPSRFFLSPSRIIKYRIPRSPQDNATKSAFPYENDIYEAVVIKGKWENSPKPRRFQF